MNIGEYRHRVQVYTPTETRDANGGVTRVWALDDIRWCKVMPLTGRELVNAAQTHSDVTHKIFMRYYAGMKASYKLIQADHIFHVLAVLNPSHIHDEMELICVEQATANMELVGTNDDGNVVYNDDGATVLVSR